MTDLFSVRELLEVAILEEQTGAAFYRALAAKTADKELEAFARRVAEMEDAHEQLFSDMLERCRKANFGREAPSDYMAYMAQGRIVPTDRDGAELAETAASDAEGVGRALQLERDTLLFYLEMKPFVPESERPLLEDVISEERQHVTDWVKFQQSRVG